MRYGQLRAVGALGALVAVLSKRLISQRPVPMWGGKLAAGEGRAKTRRSNSARHQAALTSRCGQRLSIFRLSMSTGGSRYERRSMNYMLHPRSGMSGEDITIEPEHG